MQVLAGVAFPVTPALAFTIDYRFMGLTGDRNYGAAGRHSRRAVTAANIKFSNNYNNMALVGFRYAFNAAPPPPMAPPPAAVAPSPISRSYLVFFDWDKADLTDRARQIVSEAAANSTKVQYTQIEVNGYTDTSGTPKYNQGLSVRRAKAVAAELVKDGVPATPSRSRASAKLICWFRPARASVSRRTGASKSSSSRFRQRARDWRDRGAFGRPFFVPERVFRMCRRLVPRSYRQAADGT